MKVENGIYFLDPKWAGIERSVLQDCISFLLKRGFEYWQVPATVEAKTYENQGIKDENGLILGQEIGDTGMRLSGSAEQGILQMLSGTTVEEPLKIVAHNTCFRLEPEYHGLKRLREFQKVEQYVCTNQKGQDDAFEEILENAISYMRMVGVDNYRITDRTTDDIGYHEKKLDIEVWTRAYGWLETHSCSRFGSQQARRYKISGPCNYTLSNTGAATPRLLVPLMEQAGIDLSFLE